MVSWGIAWKLHQAHSHQEKGCRHYEKSEILVIRRSLAAQRSRKGNDEGEERPGYADNHPDIAEAGTVQCD